MLSHSRAPSGMPSARTRRRAQSSRRVRARSAIGVPWWGVPTVTSERTRPASPQVGQRVAGVEAAQAVRDQIDARVRQRLDRRDQLACPLGDRGGHRQTDRVGVTAERLEVLGDPVEVVEPCTGDADPIEPEQATHEHYR